VNLLALISLPLLAPGASFSSIGQMLFFVLLTSGLTVSITRHRASLESDRQAEFLESSRQLEAMRASLEQRNEELRATVEQYDSYMA
jgi:hypothetical protein